MSEYPYAVREQELEPVYEDVAIKVVEETVDVAVAEEIGVAVFEPGDVTDKREALSVADEMPELENDIALPVRDYADDLYEGEVPAMEEQAVDEPNEAEYEPEESMEERYFLIRSIRE